MPVFIHACLHAHVQSPLLDAIVLYLPSPLDKPPTETHNISTFSSKATKTAAITADDIQEKRVIMRDADERDPLLALAFKVIHDPQVSAVDA